MRKTMYACSFLAMIVIGLGIWGLRGKRIVNEPQPQPTVHSQPMPSPEIAGLTQKAQDSSLSPSRQTQSAQRVETPEAVAAVIERIREEPITQDGYMLPDYELEKEFTGQFLDEAFDFIRRRVTTDLNIQPKDDAIVLLSYLSMNYHRRAQTLVGTVRQSLDDKGNGIKDTSSTYKLLVGLEKDMAFTGDLHME